MYFNAKMINLIYLQNQRLLASDDSGTDGLLGRSVALSGAGNIAIAGAYTDNNQIGAAYIFENSDDNTWVRKQKIFGTAGTAQNNFGNAVSLSADGKTAIIGAEREDPNSTTFANERGAA